jgi:hypothetical protein
MSPYGRMPFECDQPGCAYHGSSRTALAAHKRTRHPGAARSAAHTRYTLGKARERVNNGRRFGSAILSGKSRLWTLPNDIFGEISSSLTGKKGSFKQQMNAARKNVSNLARNLAGTRGGGGRTRRKMRGRKGTRRAH